MALPELSRFELQCLSIIWSLNEATVRDIHDALVDPPSYSTVRKIVERLEDKGALKRVKMRGKAWTYRSSVTPAAMIRKEIRRFLDGLFDGSAAPLVAHLAEMREVSLEDLKLLEAKLSEDPARSRQNKSKTPTGRKRRR